MNDIKFSIPLAPVTKKNSQRIVRCGRYSKILPSKAYVQYEKNARQFLPLSILCANLNHPCEISALFYMPTHRKVDLTNLLEAIDDVLVAHHVLEDDNASIIVSHDGSRVKYDKAAPRTDITIRFL